MTQLKEGDVKIVSKEEAAWTNELKSVCATIDKLTNDLMILKTYREVAEKKMEKFDNEKRKSNA